MNILDFDLEVIRLYDYSGAYGAVAAGVGAMQVVSSIISLAIYVFTGFCLMQLFSRAGEAGWKGFVPIVNMWTLFKLVYGNGAKMFLLLIPFYNIYIAIKSSLDTAKAYKQPVYIGVLLIFVPVVGYALMTFVNKAQYFGPVE